MLTWRKINNDISLNDIADAEKVLGVIFPTELQELILHFNHGRPDKFVYDTEKNKERVFGALLNFNIKIDHPDNVRRVYESIKDKMPQNLYPFASDSAGNFICAKIINSKIEGMFLWLHEESFNVERNTFSSTSQSYFNRLEFIADSLDDFLKSLYLPE